MTRTQEDASTLRHLIHDTARCQDVATKHQRVGRLLEATSADGVLLQEPANIAWMTAGATCNRLGEESRTSVLVTPDARLFATHSVDAPQIFEREAFGLGFQLKQREWYRPHAELVQDLCRGRRILSDRHIPGAQAAPQHIRALREPLTALEVERLRVLSAVAVHAVEATAHHLKPGVTEAEVAGEISHRLLKRTVEPVRIQVCADGRSERYRHWTFGENPIQQYAVVSCTAQRWGLHTSVTRTVCFDAVPDRLQDAYRRALLVHATGLYFSRHGQELGAVWNKVHRIYEKFGMEHEWQLADQADVTGYQISECRLVPKSAYELRAPCAVFWHPSVGPALLGDTMLCLEQANEHLTRPAAWPQVPVQVKGREVMCPGILLREASDSTVRPDLADDQDAFSPSAFDCPEHPVEGLEPGRVESIWEMEMPSAVRS